MVLKLKNRNNSVSDNGVCGCNIAHKDRTTQQVIWATEAALGRQPVSTVSKWKRKCSRTLYMQQPNFYPSVKLMPRWDKVSTRSGIVLQRDGTAVEQMSCI